ncbi:ABC transporter permease [Aquipuribacter sp. MA13-6]|uniref:ABC transporter permease n=1 Tax=unclassified Aquipuribacter TaxID=2635084 RepID=UPI003EEFCCFC
MRAPEEASRLLDTGYRPYDGARAGTAGAVGSLMRYSVRRGLGFGRPFGGKVPIGLVVLVAYLPAVALVGVSVLVGDVLDQTLLQSVQGYYGLITTAVIGFAALVVPELFCTDKRTGMLGRYLATPLTRWTYLLAKAGALLALLALVSLGPPLLLVVGLAATGDDPPALLGTLDVLWRVLVATPLLALPLAAVGAAVSSLTSRRIVATAVIAVVLLLGGAVTGILFATGSPSSVLLGDVVSVAFEMPSRLLDGSTGLSDVPLWQLVTAWCAWVAVPTAVVLTSYARTKVSR